MVADELDAANDRIAELEADRAALVDQIALAQKQRDAANARADAAERKLEEKHCSWVPESEAAALRAELREARNSLEIADAEVERLTARLSEQVESGDAWRTGQGTAERWCHELSVSLAEARALLARARDCQDDSEPFAMEIDAWLAADPETPFPKADACATTADSAPSTPSTSLDTGEVLLMQRILRRWRDMWENEQPTWGRDLYDETHAALNDGSQAAHASPRAAAERAVLDACAKLTDVSGDGYGPTIGETHAVYAAEAALRAVKP